MAAQNDITDGAVSISCGAVEGFLHNGCIAYLGIPFARPPVGELAFRHPVPPEPWEGTLRAVQGSANPIQARGRYGPGNNSQDCLYLNVFVPEGVSGPMPVMVWIYGGSYSTGGAGSVEKGANRLLYDLSTFARETGCVVVSFNYRVNVYGFLNLHFLDDSFDQNNGLFDQIMALRFVKENIAAFGGNPEQITVFGQSAGAACILALMSMKEAEGLFRQAIVQSPCVEHFFTEAESEANTRAYLRYAGVKTPAELLALDEEQICRANKKYNSWMLRRGELRCAFSPTIDGQTLCSEPKQAVKSSKLPMMIGNTSQECNLFVARIPAIAVPFIAKYLRLKVPKGPGSYKQRASDALTQHVYVRPLMEILSGYSGSAWRYLYDYTFPGSTMGCFHICELPVLFGIWLVGYDGAKDALGPAMRAMWARFAREGNPGWEEGTAYTIRG